MQIQYLQLMKVYRCFQTGTEIEISCLMPQK